MALVQIAEGSGGDIIPIIKYDCRAGRMFRRDRVNNENEQVDITRDFKAVFDFENAETGWIDFNTGGAPAFAVARWDKPQPACPTGGSYKSGVRVLVKLHASCGGDVRELASVAKAYLSGLNKVHDAYLAERSNHPDKLPVIALAGETAITTGEGAKKSTNYSPNFIIVGWTARPTDLVHIPREGQAPSSSQSQGGPPSTGSRHVPPPQAAAAAYTADDDDFG